MTTSTRIASTTQEIRDRMTSIAATARSNLTAHVHDADDLRDLGLMLGLLGHDRDGSLVRTTPWDPDDPLGRRS